MRQTVLVTGGAGYIGSYTCKALAAAGFLPVSYDNLVYGHRWAVKWGPLVEGDLANQELLEWTLREYRTEGVVHFAGYAYVGESIREPSKHFTNNVVNTLNLLDVMRRTGVRHIVFSSTCATYGIPAQVPISEDCPQQPVNPYGESKLFIELVIQAILGHSHEVEIYGTDYETPDGTAIRDYIHVTDLARLTCRPCTTCWMATALFALNLGTGRGHSVREVIKAVERVGGVPVPTREGPRRPGDPSVLVAGSSQARCVLG
jgi:UDP-glucose 4-epimerase